MPREGWSRFGVGALIECMQLKSKIYSLYSAYTDVRTLNQKNHSKIKTKMTVSFEVIEREYHMATTIESKPHSG